MKVGSLFAGIGGFDLAARNMGWTTAWFSEIHPYACRVLDKHWPGVPNHGDIMKIDFTQVEPVEVLCGGFPCQDISVANTQGKGVAGGRRSGLWRHYARAIGELRPRYVVVENSPNLLTRGLDLVLGDLAALGYDAWWDCLPLAAVGAPHLRDRLWLVAYPQHTGMAVGRGVANAVQVALESGGVRRLSREGGELQTPAVAPDPVRQGLSGQRAFARRVGEELANSGGHGWWASEPRVARVVYGLPARVDRTFGLGNAIGPQVAEAIFRAIQAQETGEKR